MDGIKLEAETVSGQFEGGDPHLERSERLVQTAKALSAHGYWRIQ